MRVNGKPSRRRPLFLLLALCAALAAGGGPALRRTAEARRQGTQKKGAVDWILVLDTSASMRGAGGSRDIFEKVKESLEDFVRNARAGDSITIYTFDRDTITRPTVRISDETDKRDVLNIIRGIQANGDKTHTGKAIRDALLRAAELKQRSEAAHRVPAIVLLTDGKEDVSGISNPVSIPSNVSLVPNSQPYVFFVSLGQEHDRQLEEFVRGLGDRGGVVRDPGAENIADLAERIREPVEEAAEATPTPTPLQVTVTVEPATLDFGRVEPGGPTGRQTLTLNSNVAVPAQFSLEGGAESGITLAEPGGPVALKAGEPVSVPVRLDVAPGAADGRRTLTLKVNVRDEAGQLPPDTVVKSSWAEAHVTVEHVALWSKLWKWLLLFLIVLVLAVAAYSFFKGDAPWALWADWKRNKFLEGELVVLDPPPARDEDAVVNLAARAAGRATLSALVPMVSGGAGDAELTTARRDGRKEVRLRRTAGSVRVNDVEVSDTFLYDQDIIELGDARLRYDRVGHERPADPDGDSFA